MSRTPPQLLIFEPRTEGHHLSWLRYISEDFLSAGHRLTLAIAWNDRSKPLYEEQLGDLLHQAAVIPIHDEANRLKGGTKTAALGACLVESRADQAFVNNLDDIASSMFRRAAMGIMPPRPLKGRLSGIYFRPRFLANAAWPPGNLLKLTGFRRLVRQGWFHRICLLDEFLHEKHKHSFPQAGLTFLPDTWSGTFSTDQATARDRLSIDAGKLVLLHYGIGTRRKGLHLVIRALREKEVPAHWHLLCAGKIETDKEILDGLRGLAEKGAATVLDRYVSKAEEALCFAAADIVLLPYVRHFGSSGVLALAAAAGKMVVASDEGLVARRVKDNGLGLCFPSGDVPQLANAFRRAESLLKTDGKGLAAAAGDFAGRCDRQAFRSVITTLYPADRPTEAESA